MPKKAIIKALMALPRRLLSSFRELMAHVEHRAARWLYSPSRLAKDGTGIELETLLIDEQQYSLAILKDARISTDTLSNIGLIVGRKLVPKVSWQYHQGKVLDDAYNHLLTGELVPSLPLHKSKRPVVSVLTGGGGNTNYYHWLFDALPRLFLLSGKIPDNAMYLVPSLTRSFQLESLEMLGIPRSAILSSMEHNHVSAPNCLATSHPNPLDTSLPRWIVEFLRQTFLKHGENCNFSPYVYVSRADAANKRYLDNETELVKALGTVGFETYSLSELSFAMQIGLFSGAKMIVGVHGAGLTNLAFSTLGTKVYELVSPAYQPQMYQQISDIAQLQYERIVCDPLHESGPISKECVRISEHDINRILNSATQA